MTRFERGLRTVRILARLDMLAGIAIAASLFAVVALHGGQP
jgi:hypothetical protein